MGYCKLKIFCIVITQNILDKIFTTQIRDKGLLYICLDEYSYILTRKNWVKAMNRTFMEEIKMTNEYRKTYSSSKQ